MSEARTRQGYHHGELPKVLMSLALSHIQEEGTEKLSLRALAREAGVSQTAPYRHFPTKKCLLAALATQGFTELTHRVRSATQLSLSVQDRFIAMGCAYVQFAIENPTAYHLMFGAVLGDFSEYDMLHNASSESYEHVLDMLQQLIDANDLDIELAHLGGVVWSGVHGMASLLLNKSSENSAFSKSDPPSDKPADESPAGGNKFGFSPRDSLIHVHADLQGSLRILFGHLLR